MYNFIHNQKGKIYKGGTYYRLPRKDLLCYKTLIIC